MKKILICGALAGLLALPVFGGEAEWFTDLPKAQAKAKAEKKLVLMDFTGSDWCPPCKALKKNVLSAPDFIGYAAKNLVLVEVDFPRHKAQPDGLKKANQALSGRFAIDSYPTVIVLNGEGKQLHKSVGYGGEDSKAFIAKLEKLKN